MSGSALTTVSPSTTRFILMVPCIAGCDGPRLISITLVAMSGAMSCSCSVLSMATPSYLHERASLHDGVAGDAGRAVVDVAQAVFHERLALVDRIILTQRVADELGVQQNAP